MENQHRKINGYRELTQAEIDLMNEIKNLGPVLEGVCAKIEAHVKAQRSYAEHLATHEIDDSELHRLVRANPELWLGLGANGAQHFLMQLTRAVAQPTFF